MSRLAPPPRSPNCVSSRAEPTDTEHHIAPLAGTTVAQVRAVIEAMPRVHIVTAEDAYVHAVFTSALFRFKDDVELEQDGDVVHIRSASRVGHSDLGANRKRVEAIRSALR